MSRDKIEVTDADGWSIEQDKDGMVTIRDNQGSKHAEFRYKKVVEGVPEEVLLDLLALWKYIRGEFGQKIDDKIAEEMMK